MKEIYFHNRRYTYVRALTYARKVFVVFAHHHHFAFFWEKNYVKFKNDQMMKKDTDRSSKK